MSFPEWRHTPIVLWVSDPEGCAACSVKTNPLVSYRNGPLLTPARTQPKSWKRIYELAKNEHVSFLGSVTWAFEFEYTNPLF